MTDHINRQALQQFGHLELLARQVVEGFLTGLHKSPFHGFSVEFAEHRLYNKGESTRHIDWKLYARTDKLFVKRYEEETNLRCQLVIDRSSSMYFPEVSEADKSNGKHTKMSFAVHCAAALIELLRKQRDAVGLSVFAEQLETHTPARSSLVHMRHLYDNLENLLKPEKEQQQTFAIDALHLIAESVHKRSLVVLFSDMMDNSQGNIDELFGALQHLRHNKHEVLLFHTVDKQKELDFNFENRPYTFIDLESGQQVKAHPSAVRETYTKAMSEFERELKLRCAQYQIDFIEADINAGFNQVLLEYLIKRGRLY